jgi:hypothetical protein
MWTREEVQRILEGHRNYNLLFDEYEGKFACEYIVSGVRILVFNCVGGIPEIWFGYSFAPNADFKDAQDFVRVACLILQERANR